MRPSLRAAAAASLAAALAALPLRLAAATDAAAAGRELPLVQSVGPIEITVRDLDRSLCFYRDVLGFTVDETVELAGPALEHLNGVFGARVRIARLRLGEEQIDLVDYLAPEGRSIPEDARSNDLTFQHLAIVVRDMGEAYQRLREAGVEHVSSGPQRLPDWNPKAAGIEAFYFRDPDRHVLEVIHFPPGKGLLRWQRRDRLFLGIDHTAIAVADTGRSLALYRDLLGLRVTGESENYGPEQERLNQVFGTRLRITSLRGPAGPGIELLEYLSPRTGRPFPQDRQPNDLVHWQTRLAVRDLGEALRRAPACIRWISPGEVQAPPQLGFARGALLEDCDGHALQLVER